MTKDSVLAALLQSENYISGETISRSLQISRAAVNHAVKVLRAEGYEIESVTNRGYRLLSSPDRITRGSLEAVLGCERMDHVLYYESADSTNRRLAEYVLAHPDAPNGLIALANEQTAGRGRRGRSFASPKNMGIYLSLLIRPESFGTDPASPANWTALTSWTAVAVCNAIEKVYGIRPGIKWVNDLLLDKKKICGILTQMDMETETAEIRDIIIGIGVNVQEEEQDFPEELRAIAGSLFQTTGKHRPRSVLAAEMIRELDTLCAAWPEGHAAYLAQYRKDSLVTGRPIRVITVSGEKEAIAEGIGDDFALHVRYPDGTAQELRGGEISVRL